MNIISIFWKWLGKENSARTTTAFISCLFFVGIFFSPDYVLGTLFAIYFIAYMATTLYLDNKKV